MAKAELPSPAIPMAARNLAHDIELPAKRWGIAMMVGWRYIKRVDASGAVYEVMGRRNDAGSEPTWLLRATDGSRREEYVTDDALRQEWMRV